MMGVLVFLKRFKEVFFWRSEFLAGIVVIDLGFLNLLGFRGILG